ncbi:hypothetical protein REH81_01555, partial [Vibrio rotiferianus]
LDFRPQGSFWTEKWEQTEYFCPKCGKRNVWESFDPDDGELGSQYMCAEKGCGATFHMPTGVFYAHEDEDGVDQKRHAALSSIVSHQ